MRFTVDSNVLVYALDAGTPDKHVVAVDIMIRASMLDMVLTAQALAEFLAVIRRKYSEHFAAALDQARRWTVLFPPIATTHDHVVAGGDFAIRHKLQFWDSVIWQAAASKQAVYFLSEDLQDGLSINGMTVLNPFNDDNASLLGEVLQED
ncbi:MAG: PIN domain-containing protein [Sphingomonas sp.]|uniref:PIN domain-containing protein n=1 Tax=Sphingomonas sp. TaxID=28214 RepID=UPI001ACBA1B9|nr:PIN domain-containing protein [Sphingomonas sp.]MBN8815286.1 PIN domain-containing protein [Sphingomonas sp.]